MTRSERRLLLDTGLIGAILTCIVATLDAGGMLAALEHYFYDLRARTCQFFRAAPTDKLVHLDIDDRALSEIGAWPWPRSRLAEIVDEINLAGAKALDLDIIFPEPQAVAYEVISADVPATRPSPTTLPSGSGSRVPGAGEMRVRPIDHDAILAQALRRYGRVLAPVNLELQLRFSEQELLRPAVAELMRDLELTPEQLLGHLQAKGFAGSASARDIDGPLFDAAGREAMYQRLAGELLANPGATDDDLRRKLLPRTEAQITDSPLLRLMRSQRERLRANIALRRFARPVPSDLPPLFASRQEQIGIGCLMESAAYTGFVDYVPLGTDGRVRSVPLWAVHRELMYPQMGLALACAMLDVDPTNLRVTPTRIIIPASGGEIVIPVRTQRTPAGKIGMFFDVPWFGGDDWKTMYDPKQQQPKQHVALSYVWDACALRHRIEVNNRSIDDALLRLLSDEKPQYGKLDPALAKKYFANLPKADDTASRRKIATEYRDLSEQYINLLANATSVGERQQLINFRDCRNTLRECLEQNDELDRELAARRAELRTLLAGKAALLGWTAAGAIADVVPTPLHARCPGVVIHGVIFNSIMTGQFWRAVPAWVNLLITMAMGLLVTAGVAALSPWKAVVGTIAVILGYLAFNGLFLFDKESLLVGVAGPVTAAAGVWAVLMLIRYVLERALRARIRGHFEQYADKKLVKYLLDHDDHLDGRVKELTVVFTDLGNFTSISEQLGERTVPLLSEYMGLMVPIIQSHNGTLNKFIGDGIMFFFGAPEENAFHTYDAIRSVLAMQEAMIPFNQSLTKRGLPNLLLRAGISSGEMIVGNAGPVDRYDYTVLGDVVNLGARLEPANKVFGTRVLVNGRARELAGDDRILFRPIGKLQVVGKKEGVMAHEPLCLIERAVERQKKLAEMTSAIVSAFMAGEFTRCLQAVEEFEGAFERGKLSALYRELCEGYLRQPPPGGFDGQIVLTAK